MQDGKRVSFFRVLLSHPNIKENVWAFTERRWLIPLPTHSILPPVGLPLIHSREQRRRETAFKPAMD
jgi:hypothetical protein